MDRILIVDDEFLIRYTLEEGLKDRGYDAYSAATVEEGLEFVRKYHPGVLLLDNLLENSVGMDEIVNFKNADEELQVIMMTAYGSVSQAVEATKRGAYDYILKPFDVDEIDMLIKRCLEQKRNRDSLVFLKGDVPQFLGVSEAAARIRHLIQVLGENLSVNVLLRGETGTGKEVVARQIHANSARRHGNYIAVNCGAIPEGTIDSELFGHEKGAFTGATESRKGYFEEADGGTIFLDEVAELPHTTQVRLLRVLQTGEFMRVGASKSAKTNVRVVAATNINLREAVSNGRFREDLYYRLNTVPITIPPLRERKGDITLLFRKFATDIATQYRMPVITLDDEARHLLENYRWPGNIRQLKNVAEQISAVEETRLITGEIIKKYLPDSTPNTIPMVMSGSAPASEVNTERELLYKILFDLRSDMSEMKRMVAELLAEKSYDAPKSDIAGLLPRGSYPIAPAVKSPAAEALYTDTEEVVDDGPKEEMTKEKAQKEAIIRALKRHNGKRRDAARELFISERTLYRKIKELGIDEIP